MSLIIPVPTNGSFEILDRALESQQSLSNPVRSGRLANKLSNPRSLLWPEPPDLGQRGGPGRDDAFDRAELGQQSMSQRWTDTG